MSSLRFTAPSKLNLFFRVLKKREDGYHDIASLFQAIDLSDTIHFTLGESDRITCSDPALACDETNLVFKARELFRRHFFLSQVYIHLEKRVPTQSGLGGGSGNAATTLWGLNQLAGRPTTEEILSELGAELGSDVPFFFSPGTAYCTGRGEQVQSVEPLRLKGWVVKPQFGLSTPLVYKQARIDFFSSTDPLAALDSFRTQTPLYFNDLEIPAFQLEPRLAALKQKLLDQGFETVVMTGSGSAFFGLGNASLQPIEGVQFYPFSSLHRTPNSWY